MKWTCVLYACWCCWVQALLYSLGLIINKLFKHHCLFLRNWLNRLQVFSRLNARNLSFNIFCRLFPLILTSPYEGWLADLYLLNVFLFVCLKRLSPLCSYKPKMKKTKVTHEIDLKKSSPMDRALEIQANLTTKFPSFVKIMLSSHVTGGFWLVNTWLLPK